MNDIARLYYKFRFFFVFGREKNNLYKTIEKLSSELEDAKEKCEELRGARQEAVRELLTLQEQHKAELRILNNSQVEEANARENMERKLCEIRSEVSAFWPCEIPRLHGSFFCSYQRVFYRLPISWSVYKLRMPLNGANVNA